jgi:hypothetical protein
MVTAPSRLRAHLIALAAQRCHHLANELASFLQHPSRSAQQIARAAQPGSRRLQHIEQDEVVVGQAGL